MHRLSVSLVVLLFILAAHTAQAQPRELAPLTKGQISAVTLWKRITQEQNYRRYTPWPGHPGKQRGKAPHGPFHRVFIHPAISRALPLKGKPITDGGIVVKEAYNTDDEMVHIAVMAKVTGYNAEDSDWFWAEYTPEGKVLASGKAAACIKCHRAFKSNDYLILHRLGP